MGYPVKKAYECLTDKKEAGDWAFKGQWLQLNELWLDLEWLLAIYLVYVQNNNKEHNVLKFYPWNSNYLINLIRKCKETYGTTISLNVDYRSVGFHNYKSV